MPELSEDKRKQLDEIVGKMHVNNESDENIQTLVNDFKSKNTVQAPPSALSRFGTGLYNTTVGPVVNTAQSLMNNPVGTIVGTLGNIAGVPQFKESWNQTKQGNYIPALSSLEEAVNPASRMASGVAQPIVQDIKSGNYAGALGQGVGTLGTLAAGAYAPESRLGQATGAGLKAGASDVAMGGLRAGVAGTIGESIPHGGFVMANQTYRGLQQAGEGLRKGARAFGEVWKGRPVPGVEPPPIPKQTGITPQQLKSATVNGHMTPEQFDATIDARNDLTPELKAFHKDDLRSAMQKASPPSLGQTEKPLSLGTMKASVKSGDNDINWFRDKLKQQGHSDEGIELESKRLEREIEENKEAEKAKSTSEPKKPPKNQTKAPIVKSPEAKSQVKVEPPKTRRSPDRPRRARELKDKPSKPQ